MFRLFDLGLGGLVGAILAGGRGHCLERFNGRPLLAHVIQRLGPQLDALVVLTDSPVERFEAFGLPIVSDTRAEVSGPLTGVHAGLAWAARNLPRARGIVSAAGDAPFLPADLVQRLTNGPPDRIAVARRGGVLQPLFAYWPVGLADALAEQIDAGNDRVKPTIEQLPHVLVDFEEGDNPFLDPTSIPGPAPRGQTIA
jgi:molybdopterin-guanine dinucleotide biosynthesis protein A